MSLEEKFGILFSKPGEAGAMTRLGTTLLTFYLLCWHFCMICALVVIWPGSEKMFFKNASPIPQEIQYLLISLICGGLGSLMPAMTSLVAFVGNRTLAQSWGLWYLLKPFIGMSVGLFLYIVIRGGIIKVSTGPDALNQYAVAGFALLGGIFSNRILDRAQSWAEKLDIPTRK